MKINPAHPILLLASIALAACSGPVAPPPPEAPAPAASESAVAAEPTPPAQAAADMAAITAFMKRIARHCGKAYAGRVLTNVPPQPDDAFDGKTLVMHVRECSADELKIPFHVGDDHSRTWVLTRTATGLRLKHDHRHQDGSHDAVTMYGGDTETTGSDSRQEFPVDVESITMFTREGLDASVTNVWAIEIEPDSRFLYELARPGGRLFQVEFDLTTPVDAPPTPWGHLELD